MPIYEYSCIACDTLTEQYVRASDLAVVSCPACEGPAQRIISLPVIRCDFTPYYDDGLGQRIETRQQRAAIMKDKGFVEKGTHAMSGAKGTIFSHPGRPTESVPKSGAQLGPIRG
jgi:putative FmdB family regulatory protein